MAEIGFFEKVYTVALQIPFGRVTSYGAIAKYLGAAKSARMVGWAMNASHNMEDVPAHRVVNKKGLLTGKHHFEGTNLMQQLLESEGVEVVDNQIQNLEALFWDPQVELPEYLGDNLSRIIYQNLAEGFSFFTSIKISKVSEEILLLFSYKSFRLGSFKF